MKKINKRIIQIVLVIIFIAVGFAGNMFLKASRPPVEKQSATIAVPLARTIAVEAKTFSVPIEGNGTVYPLKEIQLVPQVGGKVVYISPALVNGGEYKKDEVLLKIDPADYEIAVTLAEALLKDAESKFILAEQEASVAKSDWKALHPDQPPPPLVAKEPQLATAKAKLEAQRAELERARLNLARTRLIAPFDGQVGKKNVDIGQYVSLGQGLATLYSIEASEIVLPMETENLQWFDVPGFTSGNGKGSDAIVYVDIAGKRRIWKGTVVRAEGKVDELTRMVNIVVKVDAPYAKKPPLAPGLFASVNIQGKSIENGVIIPRSAIHQDNVVWVVDKDGRLEFRTVEVALRSRAGIVLKSGLSDKEQVVVSPIKEVTNGMKVRNVPAKDGVEQS
ncbi:MAG: efflux RND transporter periplasmic adaptor subunit [Proteobacteria bacterium]|nr:efflux RND transporter periplasmic adaptor subunit [Pseudomonadota bacterium]